MWKLWPENESESLTGLFCDRTHYCSNRVDDFAPDQVLDRVRSGGCEGFDRWMNLLRSESRWLNRDMMC